MKMESTKIQKAVDRINERIERAVWNYKLKDRDAEYREARIASEMVKMLREDFGIKLIEDIRDFEGVENIIFWKLAD